MGAYTGFPSPCGDGTESGKLTAYKKMFSPPYGDSTDDIKYREAREKFSPPYEDGTLNISQNIVKWKN